MTRRRWMVRLAGMAAGLALGVGPAAGQGIPVTVGVGAIQTGAGAFDLPVVVDMSARTERLGSFVVTLRWNPAVLQMQGGVEGTFGGITVNEDSLATGMLQMAGVNPAGVGGLITLGVGRFTVLTNDTTTFRITVQELYAATSFADLTASAVPLDRLFCGSLAGTWGDVNRDAAVNGADALIVLTESVGLSVSQFAMGFGDVDSSGTRDPRDALIILSYAVGIPTTTFRVGVSVGGAICTPPGAQSYAINPASAEALVGQSMNYFAFGLDSTGAALALRNVTWVSSNPGVASVDASGVASAVAVGSTTISARQNDTTIASGTLTVPAVRRTHWVDALALTARNQVGSAAHPFGVLQDAVSVAAAGDTLRVRSGRLPGATIDRSLTVMGDTTAGGARPVLIPADPSAPSPLVLSLTAPASHVAIRDVQVDTAAYGIASLGVDTVDLYHVDVRGAGGGIDAVHVDSAALIRLNRVRLFGRPNAYGFTRGLVANGVATVVVDSSLFSDFTGDGVFTSAADSIVVRNSTLQYNGNAGLEITTPDTASAARLVFSHNRVIQNQYYGVYGYYLRQASFDHNLFQGDQFYYSGGIQVAGSRAGVLTLLADTVDVQGSDWLDVSTMDSVLVDSLTAVTSYYGGYVSDARVVVVRNSEFTSGYYEAFYVYGRGVDSTTLLVRNSRFKGLSNLGYYDGYGVQTYYARADVRDSDFSNLYYGIEAAYGAVDVSHTMFDRSYYAVYNWCAEGDSRIDSTKIQRASYGVYMYGCGTGPATVVLDSLDLSGGGSGIYVQQLARGQVRHSRFGDVEEGVYFYGVDTAIVDTSTFAPLYSSVRASYDSVTVLTGNAVTCLAVSNGFELVNGARAIVQGNTLSGPCDSWSIDVAGIDTVDVRGNTINGSGDNGIYTFLNKADASARVVGNTVTGPFAYGSIRVEAVDGLPTFLRVDSNAVASGTEAGIISHRGDSLLIRDNTVTGIKSGSCCTSYDGGIVIGPSSPGRKWALITRNRVLGASYGIRVDRAAADTTVSVVVDTNRVVGSDSVGIIVAGYGRVLARHNTIDSTGRDGVRVDRFITADPLHVRFANNNFTRSARYGVVNLDGGVVDAASNWWGDVSGPAGAAGPGGIGDSVSSGVDWSQFLQAPAVTLPPAPPAFLTASLAVPGSLRGASRPTLPALREPRAAMAPPAGNAPERWGDRDAERQRRQEARIQRYRQQIEREAAHAAARAASRAEGRQ